MSRPWVLLVAPVLATGCYETTVHVPGKIPTGPEHQHRQWFTLAGSTRLTDPHGDECPQGVAESKSLQSGTDILIGVGLVVGGVVAGAYACSLPDDPTADEARSYSRCVTLVAAVPPLLLASRTVRYRCSGLESGAAADGAEGDGDADDR